MRIIYSWYSWASEHFMIVKIWTGVISAIYFKELFKIESMYTKKEWTQSILHNEGLFVSFLRLHKREYEQYY